jgi:hypothetical protein
LVNWNVFAVPATLNLTGRQEMGLLFKGSFGAGKEQSSSFSRLSLITILIHDKMHLFTITVLVGLALAGPLRREDGREAGKRDLVGGRNLNLSNS